MVAPAAPLPGTRSRRWIYTFNNYTDEDETSLQAWTRVEWHVYGREVAPLTGTRHLQGAFSCKNAITWSQIVAKFPGIWCEPMRGSVDQAFEYCTKSDPAYFESGRRPEPKGKAGGEANAKNWELAKELAISGKVDEIDANIYIPYYSSILRIASKHQAPLANLTVLDNHWYYGKSGTGKSWAAREEFGASLYIKNINKWWDGYDGQENVLIDDLDVKHDFMGYFLKIWADIYFFNAEVKGSTQPIRPKRIIVTSNYHPNQVWTDENTLQPLLRRFKVTRFASLVDRVVPPVGESVRGAFVPGFVPPPIVVPPPLLNPVNWDDEANDVNLSFSDLFD